MRRCACLNWIKSEDNKFLILNESDKFQAQNLSIEEQEGHPGEAQRSIYTGLYTWLERFHVSLLKTRVYVLWLFWHKLTKFSLLKYDILRNWYYTVPTFVKSQQKCSILTFKSLSKIENTRLCNSWQNTNLTSTFTRIRTERGRGGWFCTPFKAERRRWCAATTSLKFSLWKWWVEANGSCSVSV